MKLITSATNFDSLAGHSGTGPSRRQPPRPKKEVSSADNLHSPHPVEKTLAALSAATESKENKPVKKRVRLKPESREQLLERLRNPPLSLHEAAILLRVSRATVRRYADAGRLPCQRTDGGQRRFCLRDIENFYRQLKLKR